MSVIINACTPLAVNPPGRNCRGVAVRFRIRTNQPFVSLGLTARTFQVDYFKYGSSPGGYRVEYNPPQAWTCTCPDFNFQRRAEFQTCCKHIQACIDKVRKFGPARYQQFLNTHVQEISTLNF